MKEFFAFACVAVVLNALPFAPALASVKIMSVEWNYWEARKAWSEKNGVADWRCGLDKLLEAAEKGDANAQILAGISMCRKGFALPYDCTEGIKWLEKAAATGNLVAQLKLAESIDAEAERKLKTGDKREYSLKETLEDARKTCASKDAHSSLTYPRKAEPEVAAAAAKEKAKALELFRKMALQGDPVAEYRFAVANSGRDLFNKEKLALLQSSADKGYLKAQAYLAELYTIGNEKWSPVPKDLKKAAELYAKAAAQGEIVSSLALAHMYLSGKGLQRDHAKALQWFREVNKNEDVIDDEGNLHIDAVVDAKINIGLLYQKGLGVEKGEKEAVRWFRRAAHFFSPPAQYLLGQAYETGTGVPQDNFEAYVRYKLATLNCCTHPLDISYLISHDYSPVRDMNAEKKVAELAKKLTPAELKRADEFAEEEGMVIAAQENSAHSWYIYR